MLIEVIVTTLEDALEAEQGGAGRLEVVRDLARGGLTPPAALVAAIRARVHVPLRVMVRETEAHVVSDPVTVRTLEQQAAGCAEAGGGGLVLGFTRDGAVDEALLARVLAAAGPGVRATFHRAFDEVRDQPSALRRLGAMPGVDRVLTDGGPGPWRARLARLSALAAAAPAGVTVLPGSGVDRAAVRALAAAGVFREAHAGRAAREPATPDGRVRAHLVRALVDAAR